MSGEPVVFKLESTSAAPSSFPVVLKKIMEMPPPNILDDDGKIRIVVKKKRPIIS